MNFIYGNGIERVGIPEKYLIFLLEVNRDGIAGKNIQ